jgi:enoyl-[acyl-carrier protein] reductase II
LRRAVVDGDVENGSLMAGQSVGMVTREQPTREILDELVAQAVDALMARDRAREQHLREDERRQAGG